MKFVVNLPKHDEIGHILGRMRGLQGSKITVEPYTGGFPDIYNYKDVETGHLYRKEWLIYAPNPPHKHAETIKAWADGATIECYQENDTWLAVKNPKWIESCEYRVSLPATEKQLRIAELEKQLRIAELEKQARDLADQITKLKES